MCVSVLQSATFYTKLIFVSDFLEIKIVFAVKRFFSRKTLVLLELFCSVDISLNVSIFCHLKKY